MVFGVLIIKAKKESFKLLSHAKKWAVTLIEELEGGKIMSRPSCEICDDPNPNMYDPDNEAFYCVMCYTQYQCLIKCDCDGSCEKCQRLIS